MTTEPISWSTAERVATRISGQEPFSSSYLGASLEADFVALTVEAERMVAEETGLHSSAGPARVRVTDRQGWARANVASMQRMLQPLSDRLGPKLARSPMAPASRVMTGTQLGLVLGWMSTRVLGQYDLLLLEDDHPEDQDIVYYVGPNIIALEKRFAFPPEEFRLWIALHECTHRAQFTGVPWLPEYFRTQVHSILDAVDTEPKHVAETLKRVAEQVKAGDNPVADGGMLAMLASPEQQQSLRRVLGLMALLEGHGDVTMSRAAGDRIPSAERFHRALHQRRSSATGVAKFMQKVLGLDAKMKQYAEGEAFIEAVEAAGGRTLMNKVWERSENLPTLDEIRDPQSWISRMQPTAIDALK